MEQVFKGRGAGSNPAGRFARSDAAAMDDGWYQDATPASVATEVRPEAARSIITHNKSPDLRFSQSINPYRGCEHGCIYCYARPSHAYMDLSPGIDFETRLFYKEGAARLLRAELARPGYRCEEITLGANTDPYQPIEREHRITRALLEVMLETRHPVSIVTKGALVLRDLDLLARLAELRLVQVFVSLTTLDPELKRTLEPRAASGQARLRVMRELSAAGVRVGVFTAPLIPAVNDGEMETLLAAAAEAGASRASYALLRLPHEVAPLFREWLDNHLPQRAAHVMSLVNQARGGRDNDPRFHARMRGEGPYAQLLQDRFRLACRKLGLNKDRRLEPETRLFQAPAAPGRQLSLGFE
ncbi:MAG: PA0069 family radical SAM protein [Steroidobacteraceae bacterium]